jgi:serine/threonine-protein kinase RsbW
MRQVLLSGTEHPSSCGSADRQKGHHSIRLGLGQAGELAISNPGLASMVPRSPALSRRGVGAPVVSSQELWLRADAVELRTARRFAESAADHFGLGEDARFRFTLAVNEAVANAIEHGSPSAEGKVMVRVCADPEGVRFEVRDWGTFTAGFPDPEGNGQRGRGLPLMAALVDEVDLKPGDDGTLVTLLIRTN